MAGHPRSETKTPAPPSLDLSVFVGDERARSHEAHFASENVHQLWQLVKRRPAEETADARHARIVGDLDQTARLVWLR